MKVAIWVSYNEDTGVELACYCSDSFVLYSVCRLWITLAQKCQSFLTQLDSGFLNSIVLLVNLNYLRHLNSSPLYKSDHVPINISLHDNPLVVSSMAIHLAAQRATAQQYFSYRQWWRKDNYSTLKLRRKSTYLSSFEIAFNQSSTLKYFENATLCRARFLLLLQFCIRDSRQRRCMNCEYEVRSMATVRPAIVRL